MRKILRDVVLFLSAGLLCGQIAAQSSSAVAGRSYDGMRIQEVRITCVTAPDFVKLIEKQLTFQVGDRFSSPKIRESIRNIYALKRFSQVVVDADEVEGGVRISVCPVQIQSITKLNFSGNRAFSEDTLSGVLGLHIGDGLSSKDPQYLAHPLLKFYRENGYLQARILPQIMETETGTGVMLVFDIQEGAPGKIGSVVFAGQTVFDDTQLVTISALRPGRTFTPALFDKGLERIRTAYVKKSYFHLTVVSQNVTYNAQSGEAEVQVTLDEGFPTHLRFEGNARIKDSVLKKLITLRSANDLSETALEGHRQTLLTWYREKGYHFIDVSMDTSEEQGQSVVLFRMTEGPRVAVEQLVIQGNQSISTKDLHQVMLTNTGGLFTTGWYQETVFDEDVLAIKAYYEQQGYLGIEIVSVARAFSPDQSRVSLTITIAEGVQTSIVDVRILGEPDEGRAKRIQRLNTLKVGEPLTTSDVSTTVGLIRNYYNNQGYLNANIDVSTAFNEDNSQVIVTIQISSGQQFFIGNISIQGVVKTKKSFITRELLVEQGDIFNPQKVRDTVRRLHQLGLYDSVRFQRLDSKNSDPVQNMLLSVDETSAKDMEFGFGYSTELGARGFVEYADRNVLNYGGKGTARAEMSLERPKLTLQYLHPHLLTQDTRLIASLFDEFQRDNPSFNVEKRGGRLAAHHTFDPTLSLSVGYLFEQVDPSNVKDAAQISPYDNDVLNLGGLDTQVLWDFRDDIIQPRKGGVNQLYLRMTSKSLGAEAEFFEAQAQSNWYWRVLGDVMVACAFNGKIIEPADGSKQVPIYARYFLGGDNTVRGFKKYGIGPSGVDDEGNVERVGGNRLIRGNVEIRFPIYNSFGGVLFYDAGANWINKDGFQRDYIREGAGIGLRVATPIGPLRLDYGWKMDRKSGESAGEYYLTIGSAF